MVTRAQGFKRFTDLTLDGLSPTARLLVLAGPNGSGKSSFFDALKAWHWYNGSTNNSYDATYHQKIGAPIPTAGWTAGTVVQMHEEVIGLDAEGKKKLVYMRSTHRNEADFVLQGLFTDARRPGQSARTTQHRQ
jgi:ABC-type Mn2+/Zn2+ transport system ATPase subunit